MAASIPSRAVLVAVLALLLGTAVAQGGSGWRGGRVTYFDVANDDLTTANCHLQWNQINTGKEVAALSDQNSLFSSSCGMCLEIRCENAVFKDGFGQSLDRSNACYDTGKSVFVTVADACPCNYPNNADSNRRWCCGDDASRDHIDVTRGAFSTLADLGYGVIGVQWRVVDCKQVKQDGNYYPDLKSANSAPSAKPGTFSGFSLPGTGSGTSGTYAKQGTSSQSWVPNLGKLFGRNPF